MHPQNNKKWSQEVYILIVNLFPLILQSITDNMFLQQQQNGTQNVFTKKKKKKKKKKGYTIFSSKIPPIALKTFATIRGKKIQAASSFFFQHIPECFFRRWTLFPDLMIMFIPMKFG